MNKLTIQPEWYQKLLEDLRKLEFTGIVLTKWNQGKRILQDFDENGKPRQGRGGNKRIENIAKDLNVGTTAVYDCIKFADKFKDSDTVGKLLGYS